MHRYWEKKRDKSKLMMKNDQRNRGKKKESNKKNEHERNIDEKN